MDIFNKILTKFEMKINTMKLKLTALLLVLYTGLYAQNKIVLTAPRLDTSSLSNRINLKANTSLNNVNGVLSSTYGGAGSVSGILKANGSGVVSPVIASDITTLISGTYLPLSGGTLSGALSGTSAAFSGATQLATSSGRVLIKTTTDNGTDALQVAGSGRFVAEGTTTHGITVVGNAGAARDILLAGQSGYSNGFRVQYNGTNMVYQMNDGNLTVGGTLGVTGAATFSSSVTANGGVIAKGITNDNTAFALDATNSSGSSLFKVRNDGAAIYSSLTGSGIRVVTSSGAGQLAATLLYTTAETASTLAQRDGSGALTATGFVVSSDLRFKDIITQDGDLYQYTLKADEEKKIHYGYIAQEVEKTLPFAVTTNSEGYKAINYIEVHAIKIRELEKQIEELKKLIKK